MEVSSGVLLNKNEVNVRYNKKEFIVVITVCLWSDIISVSVSREILNESLEIQNPYICNEVISSKRLAHSI